MLVTAHLFTWLLACLLACLFVGLFVCLFVCLFLTTWSFCDPFPVLMFRHAGFFQCRPPAGTAASLWKTFGPWYFQPMRSWRERQERMIESSYFTSLKMENYNYLKYIPRYGWVAFHFWMMFDSTCQVAAFLGEDTNEPFEAERWISNVGSPLPSPLPGLDLGGATLWSLSVGHIVTWELPSPPKKNGKSFNFESVFRGWVVSWQKGGLVSKFESLKSISFLLEWNCEKRIRVAIIRKMSHKSQSWLFGICRSLYCTTLFHKKWNPY